MSDRKISNMMNNNQHGREKEIHTMLNESDIRMNIQVNLAV